MAAGAPEYAVIGLAAAALARAALGQNDAAATLLAEIVATPGAREIQYYAIYLPDDGPHRPGARRPAARRTSCRTAASPTTPSPSTPSSRSSAALAEARGDYQAAADGYAEAAERWERFGVVPEQAFALLGQGRCLTALGRPTEATHALAASPRDLRRAQGSARPGRNRHPPPAGRALSA